MARIALTDCAISQAMTFGKKGALHVAPVLDCVDVYVCLSLTQCIAVGLDLPTLHAALTGGAANSWALEVLGKKMIEADFKPTFMVRLRANTCARARVLDLHDYRSRL